MDLSLLEKLDDARWAPRPGPGGTREAVILFGTEPLLVAMDEKVLEQILNTSRLPGLAGPAMTMPDAHWGYGFPIGGVAAFDPEREGVISAGGVGFDISCGIRTIWTDLTLDQTRHTGNALADELFRRVPAGVGEESPLALSLPEMEKVMEQGAAWAVAHGYGEASDLVLIEEGGCMAGARPKEVSERAKLRQQKEMGTLGSGNHYLEVQVVDRILDPGTARAFGLEKDRILVSIHCGSRGLGHQVGTDFMMEFAREAARRRTKLPDRELACAPIRSTLGQAYIGAMNAAINVALANRQILSQSVREVLSRLYPGVKVRTLYDVSHNTCKEELHRIHGKPRRLWVHRKGATRALGPGHPFLPQAYRSVGQPVFVGGSMGTGSWVMAGVPESEALSFSSASHGAGRALSRHEALRRWNGREVKTDLESRGILIRSKSLRGIAEEAPGAYKDIDLVAEATEQAGLARRVAFLRPLVCLKG